MVKILRYFFIAVGFAGLVWFALLDVEPILPHVEDTINLVIPLAP